MEAAPLFDEPLVEVPVEEDEDEVALVGRGGRDEGRVVNVLPDVTDDVAALPVVMDEGRVVVVLPDALLPRVPLVPPGEAFDCDVTLGLATPMEKGELSA
jgi:hypothetical protein